MKYYKISEDKLRELLEDSLVLSMLNWDGVDDWGGYGTSRHELIKEYVPDADEDTNFSDVTTLLLNDYEVISE